MNLRILKSVNVAGLQLKPGQVVEVLDTALAASMIEHKIAEPTSRNGMVSTTLMSATTAWSAVNDAPGGDKGGWVRNYLKRRVS